MFAHDVTKDNVIVNMIETKKARCLHGAQETRVEASVSVYNVAAHCNK